MNYKYTRILSVVTSLKLCTQTVTNKIRKENDIILDAFQSFVDIFVSLIVKGSHPDTCLKIFPNVYNYKEKP